MSENPDKLSRFWQELKRRKVIRVITVYAASAFVILELLSIIIDPLRMPDWTLQFAIVFLCIGFIIAVIFSWIYDIHPEGGIVKTEPVHKVKPEEIPKSSNSWKIASYISFVVILVLIVLNVIPRSNRSAEEQILDKSIAVIPFASLSDDPELQYQADGVMDAILLHLSKIEEVRVISRTSVEQYRGTEKTVNEICEELDVAFVLEGSFRRYGDQARLIVQLIQPGREGHVWANQYDRDWADIFAVESAVAQAVAGELQAVITPEVKQRIEKVPTSNLTAWEFYQRGMEEFWKYNTLVHNTEVLRNAERLFNYALEYDPDLALAYAGLARVYYKLNSRGESFFSEDFLDTVLILADRCISMDPQVSEAYTVKGDYYRMQDQFELALEAFGKALELNPNDWNAYFSMGLLYYNDDLLKTIDNVSRAVSRYNGPVLPRLYGILGYTYYAAGIMDRGDSIMREAFKVSGDSSLYYRGLGLREYMVGNGEGILEFGKKVYATDSLILNGIFNLGSGYTETGQFESAVKYWDKVIDMLESSNQVIINEMHRIGYAYWMNGDREKGAYYLNLQKEYAENSIELGRDWAGKGYMNYDLAAVCAFLGEKDKAYENLRIFNRRDRMPLWMVSLIKRDPLFDSIREEPEFRQIVRDVEAKYQAEHERVRKWLEEQDML